MAVRIYGPNQKAGVQITTTGKGNITNDGLTAFAEAVVLYDGSTGLPVPGGTSGSPMFVAGPSSASYVTTAGYAEKFQLFTNQSAAGTSASYTLVGGRYAFSIQGTMGSASVQLQLLNDDAVTFSNFAAARTTNDLGNGNSSVEVFVGGAAVVQAVITGTPTSLYVSLTRIPA